MDHILTCDCGLQQRHHPLFPVLYIDKEIHNQNIFKANFRSQYLIYTAFNQAEAVEIINRHPVYLIIAEQTQPNEIGIEYILKNMETSILPVFIISTAHLATDLLNDSLKSGEIVCVIQKPYNEVKITYSIIKGMLKFFKNSRNFH